MAVIGVRVEARPFAWYDKENGSPNGYLVDLCASAVTNAGYSPRYRPVTARQRADYFSGAVDLDIDLLCDPTTISMARIRDFLTVSYPETGLPKLSFSPIVFLANGTYFSRGDIDDLVGNERPEAGATCHLIHEALGSDAAADDEKAASEAPAATYLTAGFVYGTTSEDEVRRTALFDLAKARKQTEKRQYLCPRSFEDHYEGVNAFCNGDSDLHFYFGDMDIVAAYMDLFEHENGGRCPRMAPRKRVTSSYEPYALVIDNRKPEFRDRFTKGLYEIFHRENIAEGRFNTHFPGNSMSDFLATLFRIYALP